MENTKKTQDVKKIGIVAAIVAVLALIIGIVVVNNKVENPFDEMIILNENIKIEEKSEFDGTKDEDVFLFVNKEEFEKLELEDDELKLEVTDVDTNADVEKEHMAKIVAIYKDEEFEAEVPYSIEKVTIKFKNIKDEYKYTIGDKLDYKDTIKATASNKDDVELTFSKIDSKKAGTTEVKVTAKTKNGIEATKKFKVTLKEKPKPKPQEKEQQTAQVAPQQPAPQYPAPQQPAPQYPAPQQPAPQPAPQQPSNPGGTEERPSSPMGSEEFLKTTSNYKDRIAQGWSYYGFYPTQNACKSAMDVVSGELMNNYESVQVSCILNSHVDGGLLMYKGVK